MTTKKYICNPVLLVAFFLVALFAQSQNADFVQPGPSGNFIGLGKNVPNGIKTASYKIERADGGDAWKFLSECRAPSSFEDFKARVELSKNLFSGNSVPPQDQLEKLWKKAVQSGTFEPGDSWALTVPVRIALGMIYLDRNVKEKGKYKYRVTAIDPAGATLEQSSSPVVSWPFVPVFDSLWLAGFDKTSTLVTLKWKSLGKKPAKAFRVYCFDNGKPKMLKGNCVIYTKKDTTVYLYKDSSPEVAGQKDIMFFMMPMDAYENLGKSSSVIDSGTEFSPVYFTRTNAVKSSEGLGIKLTWRVSDKAPVKLIEVYRSLDAQKGFSLITTLSPADSAFTDPNVIPDKIHYYYLQARGAFEFQKTRSNIFFDYGMDPRPPVTPAIYKAVGIKNGVELTIFLNDVYLSGIRVFRSDGQSDSLHVIGDLVRSDRDSVVFRDTSAILSGYNYYHYAVQSESTSHIFSPFSNQVTVRPSKETFPDPPESFNAYLDGKKVKLFWDNGGVKRSLLQGYKLTRREETGNKNDVKPFISLSSGESMVLSNYFTDSTAEAGKNYSYSLQSVDIYNGISRQSSIVTIQIPDELPIPPTDLRAINAPEGVILEWGPAVYETLDMYRIYRYQRETTPEVIKFVGKNINTYTDNTAKAGQLYFYYLTTIDKKEKESVPCQEVGVMR